MALHETVKWLAQQFSGDPEFGMFGLTGDLHVVRSLEESLNVKFPIEVKEFIEQYGSIQFGTQCLDFVPNDLMPGCVEWTHEFRSKYPEAADGLVVIHQDEAVNYLLDTQADKIYAWETYQPLGRFYRWRAQPSSVAACSTGKSGVLWVRGYWRVLLRATGVLGMGMGRHAS